LKNNKNLIVDLDFSLLKIDLFKELLFKSMLKRPIIFLKTIALVFKSKAKAKLFISNELTFDIDSLPYNEDVIKIIKRYRKNGYKITLATGAAETHANLISNYLGLFSNVISTKK
tara:strand:+ start:149 stop:493 length:345 start_codon:yes stop_codon:yes gene_type:complete